MAAHYRSSMAVRLLVAAAWLTSVATANFYVCEAGSPKFLGHYVQDSVADGSPKFVNEEGMSIYRHQGYWYIGDLAPWPPETHYRCIEGCGHMMPTPPTSGYQPKKLIGVYPAPILQDEPCAVNDEL